MLYKSLAVLCLLNNVVLAEDDRLPPSNGKYFYADYKSSAQNGVKYVEMQIGQGDARRKMNVFVTTSRGEIGIITSKCPNPQKCDVPSPFNEDDVKKTSDKNF